MIKDLSGKGWFQVAPPRSSDDENVIARYDGEPINSGFLIDKYTDTMEMFHGLYRSGRYDIELKVDFDIGRARMQIEEADGYTR